MKTPLLTPITCGQGSLGSLLSLLGCLIALLLATPATAQRTPPEPATLYEAQKSMVVSTIRFPEARAAALGFIRRRSPQLQKQEETPEQLIAEFVLPLAAVPAFDSLAATFGYVQENNLNRQNLDPRLLDLRANVASDSLRLVRVQEQLKLAAAGDPDNYRAVQGQVDAAVAQLRNRRLELNALTQHGGQAYVTLRLFDEVSFPVANRKVNFVNMPGVEFGYLHLDNPRPGFSAANYRGYAVKYLVTRGKSYFNLGIYKAVQPSTEPGDSLFINELALINFGQDFYPRNFGRGKRRYLNLYTGYQIGGFIANRNNEKKSEFIVNANLSLGLELLKTKHVLLDVKESYFLPIHRESRNLRGLLTQASFNFVF